MVNILPILGVSLQNIALEGKVWTAVSKMGIYEFKGEQYIEVVALFYKSRHISQSLNAFDA